MGRFLRTETNNGGHSRLEPPVVVTAATPYFRREPATLVRSPAAQGRYPHSRLGPPVVVGGAIVFHGPRVKLVAPLSRDLVRRKPLSGLGRPTVINPIGYWLQGPMVQLDRIRPPATKSKLRPPTVVAAPVVFYGPAANLTYSRRGVAKPRLPEVVYDARVYEPIAGYLTRPLDRVPKTKPFLRAPVLVFAAVTVFTGPEVRLARSFRGKPDSTLRPPAVVAPVLARAILTHLAYSRRGVPKSKLSPPAVVAPVLARPIDITLVRIRPAAVHSILRRPTDLVDAQDLGYVRTHLAYSRRGAPKSRLSPPTVVAPVLFSGPATTLAYSRRGVAKPFLREVVYPAFVPALHVGRLTPARDKNPPVKSRLSAPTVLATPGVFFGPAVKLAYSRRGKAKPFLRAPVLVFAAVTATFTGPAVHLARSSRGKPDYILRPPTVVGPVLARAILAHLAPSSRGKAKPHLSPPAVVAPVLARPILVHLAYSSRGTPKSELRPPAVVAPVLARPILVHLAPSSRGEPKPHLSPPTVVFPFFARPTQVHLAYSLRGKPKSKLSPPAIVFDSRPADAVADITLVRIRPPKTIWLLRPPTVVTAATPYFRREPVTLAYQSRGKPKSRLGPPVVVGQFVAEAIETTLVRIRPAAVHSVLGKPIVVFLAVEIYGPETTLVRIRPPRTMWNLGPMGPPAVVYRGILTHLAYSRRGIPKSNLAQASLFTPQPQADTVLLVHLAYSRRGTPKSKLNPPAVVRAATAYFRREPVTLAYQSRGKPKSELRPPIVVNERPIFYFGPTTFAPIPRRKTRSFLRPPVKVFAFVARPEQIHLAPQSRGVPKSILRPPVVVRTPSAGTLSVHLAYSRRGAPKSILRKPTVVGAAEFFYGPNVTLVRIRPPRTMWLLRPPTAIITTVCYGDPMCGFDFAAEVCGSTDAATVIGSTTTGSNVTGSDVGATVEGASAARGSVTGDDARREGC